MTVYFSRCLKIAKKRRTETSVRLFIWVFMDHIKCISLLFCGPTVWISMRLASATKLLLSWYHQTCCLHFLSVFFLQRATTESSLMRTTPSQAVSQHTAVHVQGEFLWEWVSQRQEGKLIKPSYENTLRRSQLLLYSGGILTWSAGPWMWSASPQCPWF